MKRGQEKGKGVLMAADRRRRQERRQAAVDAPPAARPEPEPEPEPLHRLAMPDFASPQFGRRSPARPLLTPERRQTPPRVLDPVADGQGRRDRRRQAVQADDLAATNHAMDEWRAQMEQQWDLGNVSTKEAAQSSFLAHMEEAVHDFDLSQQSLAGMRLRRVRDHAERATHAVVAAHCADSTEAADACYTAMALVEDALAQLTDELTACATWRKARVDFLTDLRKENHASKTRLARIVRVETEESKGSEIADLKKQMEKEKRELSQDGAMTMDQMRTHLKEREQALLHRVEAAKQEEAAANAAAELDDEEIKLGFQRRMLQGLNGEHDLAQSRAAQMEAATGMRELNATIHDLKAKVSQLRNSNDRQSDKLLRMEAERKRGFVPVIMQAICRNF